MPGRFPRTLLNPVVLISLLHTSIAVAQPYDADVADLIKTIESLKNVTSHWTAYLKKRFISEGHAVIQGANNQVTILTNPPETAPAPAKRRLKLVEEQKKEVADSKGTKTYYQERIFYWHLSTDIKETDETRHLMEKLEKNLVSHLEENDLHPHVYVFTGTTHITDHLSFAEKLCRKLWQYSYEQSATDDMCQPLQHHDDDHLFFADQVITTRETIVISMVPLKPFWALDPFSLDLIYLQSCCMEDTLYAYNLAFKTLRGDTWVKHLLISSYDDQAYYLKKTFDMSRQVWQLYFDERLVTHFERATGNSESMVVIAHSMSEEFLNILAQQQALIQHKTHNSFQHDFSPKTNPLAKLAADQYGLRRRLNRQTTLFMQYFPDEAVKPYRTSVDIYPFSSPEQSMTRWVSISNRGGSKAGTATSHQSYSPFYPVHATFRVRNDGINDPDPQGLCY